MAYSYQHRQMAFYILRMFSFFVSGLDWRSLFTVDDVVTSLKTGKSFSFAGGGVKSGRDSAPLLGSNQGGGGAGIRDNYQFV